MIHSRLLQKKSARHSSKRWLYQLAAATSAMTTTTLCWQHPHQWIGFADASRHISSSPAFVRSVNTRITSAPRSRSFSPTTKSTALNLVGGGGPTETEQRLTRDALQIVDKAIEAVNPYNAVKNHFQLQSDGMLRIGDDNQLALTDYEELVLVAFGKASSAMATAVLQQLQENDDNNNLLLKQCSGVVICKDDHATDEELNFLAQHNIQVKMASHPVPDERSAEAAQTLLDLVEQRASSKSLVICCISGGGSALFCQPQAPLTLQDLQKVNSGLLASGMGIQEMNVVRKRLEEGKGGRLAARAVPSQLVALVLSDVLGDPLDLIASGPTVPDTSTWTDAWDIVQQYQLESKLPDQVLHLLIQGKDGLLPDSPSEDDPAFDNCKTTLVGNNGIAVAAAVKEAEKLGYSAAVLGTQIEGEAKEIAHFYTGMALYLQQQGSSLAQANAVAKSLPAALIAGGETTVTLTPDSGKGGRNQELALAAALQMESLGLRNVVVASVGTDGTDGPTDAAGAVVDASTVAQDIGAAREALSQHNAYPYLDQLGDQQQHDGSMPPPLVKTGPTGTNVADVCVTLVAPAE